MSRALLNYDYVFLAMLLEQPEDKPEIQRHRCPICPLRKKRMCMGSPGMERAADAMVILSWWKIKDDMKDGGFFHRLMAWSLCTMLRKDYRRAAQRRPEFDRQTRENLKILDQLERQRSDSIDRTADTFAQILRAAGGPQEDEGTQRALEQLLYHIGRWIYLIDAVDDLEEDGQAGRYNPVALRFPEEAERNDYLRTNLLHSLNLARGAFELLPASSWSGIIANILYLGLPMVEEAVFSGQWKEIKKLTVRRR